MDFLPTALTAVVLLMPNQTEAEYENMMVV